MSLWLWGQRQEWPAETDSSFPGSSGLRAIMTLQGPDWTLQTEAQDQEAISHGNFPEGPLSWGKAWASRAGLVLGAEGRTREQVWIGGIVCKRTIKLEYKVFLPEVNIKNSRVAENWFIVVITIFLNQKHLNYYYLWLIFPNIIYIFKYPKYKSF